MSGLEIGVTLGRIGLVAVLARSFFSPNRAREAEVKRGVLEIRIYT